ncbi:tail fiber protein [Asticcacaulis sp.]|uniref:phage tail protein n=1 Tax=Asticcacaulis sp. TaxID=1872648 RepID=UPI002633987B|nr:tail fiber protein [Asticcacaulis sp.]
MVDYYVGEVRLFAGQYPPVDWHLCDGSLLSVSTYQALFALIGTTYGGDGVTTFGIPDLRGRVPVGQGQGTGLSPRTLAQAGGAEAVSLAAAHTPAHSHSFATAGVTATDLTPGQTLAFANTESPATAYLKDGSGAGAATVTTLAAPSISTSTGGATHNNMMPTMALTYIIALNGTFPTRG